MHLINGLYDAHRSGAPVLAIPAHIPSNQIGTQFFQETHPQQLFAECSHYNEIISKPEQAPRVLQLAMQNAVTKGGVSVVTISGDVAGERMPGDTPTHSLVFPKTVKRPPDTDISKLADLLNGAETVAIFAGIGCADAHEELIALAAKLKAPIGHSMRGKSFVEHDNPYDVGMNGLIGFGAAYDSVHECGVLLLLGTDFPYDNFLPGKKVRTAQVDTRAEVLGRRCAIELGVCGDVGETLRALLPLLSEKQDRSFLDKQRRKYEESMRKLNVYVDHVGKRLPIHPEYVAAMLNRIAAEDAIFTVDTGMCAVWAARYLRASKDRRVIGSFNHGSMANAMPQAIGAQLAYPGRQVISVSGDGGFAMLMGDFLTLLQYDLSVKVVIFDNSALRMVKLEMEVAGFPDWQTDLKNPNFAAMAESMGVLGVRIERPEEVEDGLRRALQHPGPALVDVVTDPNALSMPPHATIGQAEGFALALGKIILSGHIDEAVDTIESNIRTLV